MEHAAYLIAAGVWATAARNIDTNGEAVCFFVMVYCLVRAAILLVPK